MAYYKRIAKAAGVDSFLHKLRHTFASQLVQNGVELYTVSKLLGHSSIQMTEIDAHLTPRTLHKAVMNLPKRGMTLVGVEEKAAIRTKKSL
ncbi:MAG: tyrosine-type recombinase/integrase [Elusimicrobiaceae bacterium]|nr:tyrosine-type recombinase/integrase [Elusimicrobiaceae bacterium]